MWFEPNITDVTNNRQPEYFVTSLKMSRAFFKYYNGQGKVYAVDPPRSKLITCFVDAQEFFREGTDG